MDISETYIKMCEKATEIQLLWLPTKGDVYARWLRCYSILSEQEKCYALRWIRCPLGERAQGNWRKSQQPIWLPRQDQLQELHLTLSNEDQKNFSHFQLLINIGEWVKRRAYKDKIGWMLNASPEQLILAFVMEIEYNKTWDGENWKSSLLK